MARPRILALCTVDSGLDSIAEALRRGAEVHHILGLHPDSPNLAQVSGFVDVRHFAEAHGIEYSYTRDYSFKDQASRTLLEWQSFDLTWVSGWQRLIPSWLIESTTYGAIGGHGSPDGISQGRGRSPQNWAILLGCTEFSIAVFKISPGIDDGPILSERVFQLNSTDDIRSSYFKCSLLMGEMVADLVADPSRLRLGRPQLQGGRYFPQRLPDDGQIDWQQTAETIARHCRALGRPYPGMRTACGDNKLVIWTCTPFDDVANGEPGEVAAVFQTGEFLVNAAGGRVLVRDWEPISTTWVPRTGDRLTSVPFAAQLAEIVERHQRRQPDLLISHRILRLL